MNCSLIEKVESHNLPAGSTADVWLISVEVDDVKGYAQELVTILNDTSWIQKLNSVGRISFSRTAMRTIDKLVQDFNSVQNSVTTEFGEYMVSMSAGQSLGVLLGHSVFPISELWKEKTTHNHGFDFHTETPDQLLNFGEAKYKKNANPYSEAASQVIEFIELGKDGGDAALIAHFATEEAINNLLDHHRGFTVAFSISSDDPEAILRKALGSSFVLELCKRCEQLQIVGVKS